MRAPPPVEVASTSGRLLRTALSALVGAAAAVPLAWALPSVAAGDNGLLPGSALVLLSNARLQAGLAIAVGLMVAAACWRTRGPRPAGGRTLRWDGQEWTLTGAAGGAAEQRGHAALMLDLGPWMLVRFVAHAAGPGRAIWLPFGLAGDLARWSALRGALWNARGGAPRRS